MSPRFVFSLLLLSVVLRCIAIDRPLIDAHNFRQVHTAILTKNLIEDGYPWLKTRGDWKGFEDTTVVLELPLQMHLAGRLSAITPNLETAGRLTAIAFWAGAFLLFCWLSGQLLQAAAARWAAAIFAFSPLSIFFGQSFQPESLILFLSLAILCSFLRWCDTGRPIWALALAGALALGLMLKSNEIVHLAVPILVVGWARKGAGFFWRWEMWLVAAAGLITVIAWSKVITCYNAQSFPAWSSSTAVLRTILGTPADRLSIQYYIKLISYMAILGLTPVLALFWLRGLWIEWTARRHPMILGWGLGIVLYYLVLGPGGPAQHSYYHLVALPWFCLVAAQGLDASLANQGWLGRSRLLQTVVILLSLAGTALGLMNLYHPDRCAYEAARALARLHPAKDEAIIVAADHRRDASGFPIYPTIFFYSGTRGYNLPIADRPAAMAALLEAHPEITWVVQTHEKTQNDRMRWRERLPFFSRVAEPQPPLDDSLLARGFAQMAAAHDWTIFHRTRQ
jgi:hypothetical protein